MDKDTFEARNANVFKILLIGLDFTRVSYFYSKNDEVDAELDLSEIEVT